jgi:hypothetical protein
LHCFTPALDHPETVLESERPGKYQRGVLAKTEAGCPATLIQNLRLTGTERFQGREAGDEYGRLTDGGRVQPGFGPAETEFREIIPEKAVRFVIKLTGGR